MKPRNNNPTRQLIAALSLAGAVLAAANTFAASDIFFGPTGTEASISNPDGTWINMWGPAFAGLSFDTANPPPSGDVQGAVYVQGTWSGADADNYNMISPKTWYGEVHFDGVAYDRIEFDFKYDTNSTINPSGNAHIDVGYDTGYSFHFITTLYPNASNLGDGSWHHVTVAVPPTMTGVGSADGIGLYQWNPSPTAGTMNFWMANLVAYAKILPIPPPTISTLNKPIPGLNCFASTMGNSFYDRQEAMWRTTSGVSWVSRATAGNPVTYSFTITNYPDSEDCEAYLFLVPNPTAIDSAPDWNQAHCAIAYVQGDPTNGLMRFRYKVNDPNQQGMYTGGTETRSAIGVGGYTNYIYYTNAVGSMPGGLVYEELSPGVTNIYGETGDLGSVTNDTVLGTWTVKFTSDTDITLIAPNGSTSSFSMPSYNTSYFAESTGFNLFLGMQANQANAINKAVVYSQFAVAGVPAAYSENFLADTVLDTNVWQTSMSGGPAGILIVPVGSAYWMDWSLPDSLFSAESASTLSDPFAWSLLSGPSFYMQGFHRMLIASNPASQQYYRLAKRAFTQLQVLLPGETAAPGTPTGKTGTPSAQTVGVPFDVVVNAVDANWFPITSVSDQVTLSSDEISFSWAGFPANLAGGTFTFDAANYLPSFGAAGTFTVKAADTADATKTGTSSPVTVNP